MTYCSGVQTIFDHGADCQNVKPTNKLTKWNVINTLNIFVENKLRAVEIEDDCTMIKVH